MIIIEQPPARRRRISGLRGITPSLSVYTRERVWRVMAGSSPGSEIDQRSGASKSPAHIEEAQDDS